MVNYHKTKPKLCTTCTVRSAAVSRDVTSSLTSSSTSSRCSSLVLMSGKASRCWCWWNERAAAAAACSCWGLE